MNKSSKLKLLSAVIMALSGSQVQAMSIENDTVTGSFDNTITVGTGIRTKNQSCNDIVTGATGAGAPGGCIVGTSGLGDQGDLNYNRGNAFTTYLKGTDELLLKFQDGVKFMGRVSWLKDFSAQNTTGYVSAAPPCGFSD